MIKVLAFDLDDTLYNERNFVYGAFGSVAHYLSQKYNFEYEKLYKDIINIFNDYGRGKVFDILCNNYKINEDIDTLINVYRESKPHLKLYKDSLYILNKFKNKCELAIITDGIASVQWNKIECLDIKEYFKMIIVTDDFGKKYWKPNEYSFKEVIRYFDCKPNECMYIGDNPNKDFIGAREVGMHTVRIIRETGDHMKTFLGPNFEADYKIFNLKELEKVIEDINTLQ